MFKNLLNGRIPKSLLAPTFVLLMALTIAPALALAEAPSGEEASSSAAAATIDEASSSAAAVEAIDEVPSAETTELGAEANTEAALSPVVEVFEEAAIADDGVSLDELFAGYAQRQFDEALPNYEPVKLRGAASDNLSGVELQAYTLLKQMIQEVAAGNRDSTVFELGVEQLYDGKTSWSAAELGFDTIDDAAISQFQSVTAIDMATVVDALLADCPFDLYWFDKTEGYSSLYGFSFGTDTIGFSNNIRTVCFSVASAYNTGVTTEIAGKARYVTVDTSTGTRVRTAVANAQAIASAATGTAYEKLGSFKQAICAAVEYDDDALAAGTAYGDPWQLINVFDGVSSTNVVCEGYSKAFKYLCDLAAIDDVDCILVSGVMAGGTGAGDHMWNIVNMDDGCNYLVDVTNCDDGSIGAPDRLFIVPPTSGNPTNGYAFTCGSSSITYAYDTDTTNLFAPSQLTLNSEAYVVPYTPITGTWGTCPWEISEDGVLTVHPGVGAEQETIPYTSPWAEWADSITSVVFAAENGQWVVAPQNSSCLLSSLANVTSIDATGLDVSRATMMGAMFAEDRKLVELDVSTWDTSSVESMNGMFVYCTALTSLDLASWDTSSVTRMAEMFAGCSALRTIYVSELWSRNSVTDSGSNMFAECRYLKGGNGTRFSSNITNARYACIDEYEPGYFTRAEKTSIEEADIEEIPSQVFTGDPIRPIPTVWYGGELLVEGKDYRVSYDEDTTNAGYHDVFITGIGSYTGRINAGFDILGAPLDECDFSFVNPDGYTDEGVPMYTYFGYDIEPGITVTFNGHAMTLDSDYEISYSNNFEPGEAYADIYGLGNLDGYTELTFQIVSGNVPITDVTIAPIEDQAWTGSAVKPALTLTYNGMTLVEGTDYTVAYSNNVNPGTATVTITGAGAHYSGTTTMTFKIVDNDLSAAIVSPIPDQVYSGRMISVRPTVTLNGKVLKLNTDYFQTINFNVNVGTARVTITGRGDYVGSTTATFEIVPRTLSDAVIAAIADQPYSGSPVEPLPTVIVNGWLLEEGVDYTLSYSNNVAIGTATVTVTGTGNYTDTASATFKIAEPIEVLYSGTWGTCSWEITADDKLTVHPGEGVTPTIEGEWAAYADVIASVVFVGENGERAVAPENTSRLLRGLTNVTTIDARGLQVSGAVDMQALFYGCSKLESVDISGWRSYNAENMGSMFSKCSSLTTLDGSALDTSSAKNLGSMFYGCSSLVSLDVSDWDVSDVENMSEMFYGCSALKTLDVSNWNVISATDMYGMFWKCSSLEFLDVSMWWPAAVEDMGSMFDGCTALAALDTSLWNTHSLENARFMFRACSSLASLDVSGWNMSNVTDMLEMFDGCSSLEALDPSSWDVSSVTTMQNMFYGCSSLKSLDLSNWETSSLTEVDRMFGGCTGLTSLNLAGWDITHLKELSYLGEGVTSLTYMLDGCTGLVFLNVSGWDTSNVLDLAAMFEGLTSLKSIDLSSWDTSKVTSIASMFDGCESLETVNLTGWDVSSVARMWYVFRYCSSLETIYVDEAWSVPGGIDTDSMFLGCTSIVGGNGTTYDPDNVDGYYARIDAPGTPGYLTNADVAPTLPNISRATVEPIPSQYWTGSAITPKVKITLNGTTLIEGEDYTLSYKDNVSEGTAKIIITAIGERVTGKRTATFEIVACNLEAATMSPIEDQTYTGLPIEPSFMVHLNGKRLVKDTDYIVSFGNNTNIGQATVAITGIGNYTGTKEAHFNIVAPPNPSGTWGTCPWEISFDGVLTVYPGKGASTISTGSGPWNSYQDKITAIVFVEENGEKVVAPANISFLFSNLANVTSIDAAALDTSSVVNMSYLFDGCSSLASLDTSTWDTSSVTNMKNLFFGCRYGLHSLDLSHWDVSSVTDMSYLFYDCRNLASLDVSNWDTSSVASMSNMFYGCSKLASLDVASWDTSSVTRMDYLFYACSKLTSLDLSGWNTSSVTTMGYMFCNCGSLARIDFPSGGWDTSSVGIMSFMFQYCESLKYLDLTSWDTSSLSSMEEMFGYCSSLVGLDLSSWDTSRVLNMARAFTYCSSLKTIYAGDGWSTARVNQYGQTFYGCTSIVGGNGTVYDENNVTAYAARIDGRDGQVGYLTDGSQKPEQIDIAGARVELSTAYLVYDGTEKKPAVTVTYGDAQLVEGTDFVVTYENNVNVGTARAVVEGVWNYTGTKTVEFTIAQKDINSATVTLKYSASMGYNGSPRNNPVTSVVLGDVELAADDYEVSYKNNVNVGTATVVVTGKGNYTGTATATFKITAKSLSTAEVALRYTSMGYTGAERKDAVTSVKLGDATLAEGADFTVSYTNNVNVGTATATITGKGNYKGAASKTFKITAKSLAAAEVTLSYKSMAYTGTARKPSVKSAVLGDKTLAKGTDYTVSWSNNVNVGTATVTIAGTGNYKGTAKATFKITAKSLSAAEVTLAYKSMTYTGKARQPLAKSVVLGDVTLVRGTDYVMSWSDNVNVGTATATITGTGNYKGTAKATFSIVKAANPMTVTAKTPSVAYSSTTVRAITAANAFEVAGAQGTVTYKKTSGNAGITVASNGKVTVAKGLAKGTYSVKVTVSAAGNSNYKAKSASVTLKVTVK